MKENRVGQVDRCRVVVVVVDCGWWWRARPEDIYSPLASSSERVGGCREGRVVDGGPKSGN
ncbi:MAG: hypothetical protein ACYS1A_06640 [Planctomycetota bacterium]